MYVGRALIMLVSQLPCGVALITVWQVVLRSTAGVVIVGVAFVDRRYLLFRKQDGWKSVILCSVAVLDGVVTRLGLQ